MYSEKRSSGLRGPLFSGALSGRVLLLVVLCVCILILGNARLCYTIFN
jgi:hypothetical protein